MAQPPGYDDMFGDAVRAGFDGPYHDLQVDGVGVIQSRNPIPGSAAVLAKAVRSKANDQEKLAYFTLFVRNHIGAEQHAHLLEKMMLGKAPADTMTRIVEAITTGGTARPTKPSSHSVC